MPGNPPGTPQAPPTGAPQAPGQQAPPPVQAVTRETALAASPRVRIDTPRLEGSIALKGGRIDDLTLKDYRETVDPQPDVVLLSPGRQSCTLLHGVRLIPANGAT